MSLLVIGATGSLGRQIVKRALDEGYQVRCLVRNLRSAFFLKEWGAELIYGDLCIPETIPRALYQISAVIDASTARPFDSYKAMEIDFIGKKKLIDAAKVAKVKRFIFFSILNAEKYPYVPLMKQKILIEAYLKEASISYTIFKIGGFFQGLIQQYAIPVLEKQSIWLTSESTSIAYIDTIDAAKTIIRSLATSKSENCSLPLLGPYAWTSWQIVRLCESLSGQNVKVIKIPLSLLIWTRKFLNGFLWSQNIASRLSFAEVLSQNTDFVASMESVYQLLNLKQDQFNTLEQYLQEYFNRILKKVKDLNLEQSKKRQGSASLTKF
uniref:hypothetical protein n=1 Tax=Glaucosphaera vacuolata TaxID=38265 RepID=UPI001FCD272E|nr:hypothetical protein MW444_pgp065 [Glaucosphaera vacuolata]UNJ18695.1 hypothetical protein [Glaucosphaera vacuolata]